MSNLDDVWRGHMQLKTKAEFDNQRYDIAWGVGRHVLGSHIYDYWHDPYGHVHEHMSDGDRMTRNFGQRIHKISGLGPNGHNQWGPTVKESEYVILTVLQLQVFTRISIKKHSNH